MGVWDGGNTFTPRLIIDACPHGGMGLGSILLTAIKDISRHHLESLGERNQRDIWSVSTKKVIDQRSTVLSYAAEAVAVLGSVVQQGEIVGGFIDGKLAAGAG